MSLPDEKTVIAWACQVIGKKLEKDEQDKNLVQLCKDGTFICNLLMKVQAKGYLPFNKNPRGLETLEKENIESLRKEFQNVIKKMETAEQAQALEAELITSWMSPELYAQKAELAPTFIKICVKLNEYAAREKKYKGPLMQLAAPVQSTAPTTAPAPAATTTSVPVTTVTPTKPNTTATIATPAPVTTKTVTPATPTVVEKPKIEAPMTADKLIENRGRSKTVGEKMVDDVYSLIVVTKDTKSDDRVTKKIQDLKEKVDGPSLPVVVSPAVTPAVTPQPVTPVANPVVTLPLVTPEPTPTTPVQSAPLIITKDTEFDKNDAMKKMRNEMQELRQKETQKLYQEMADKKLVEEERTRAECRRLKLQATKEVEEEKKDARLQLDKELREKRQAMKLKLEEELEAKEAELKQDFMEQIEKKWKKEYEKKLKEMEALLETKDAEIRILNKDLLDSRTLATTKETQLKNLQKQLKENLASLEKSEKENEEMQKEIKRLQARPPTIIQTPPIVAKPVEKPAEPAKRASVYVPDKKPTPQLSVPAKKPTETELLSPKLVEATFVSDQSPSPKLVEATFVQANEESDDEELIYEAPVVRGGQAPAAVALLAPEQTLQPAVIAPATLAPEPAVLAPAMIAKPATELPPATLAPATISEPAPAVLAPATIAPAKIAEPPKVEPKKPMEIKEESEDDDEDVLEEEELIEEEEPLEPESDDDELVMPQMKSA